MASVAEGPARTGGRGTGWVDVIDRWIYVFMAGLFVVTTLIGFVPDSLMKIAAVEAGNRAPFPPILHVHAVLMGAWLMLLLAQTTLMATGSSRHHQKLGIASFILAPAIMVTGLVLVPTMFGQLWDAIAAAPIERQAEAREFFAARTDIMLLQIRAGLLFPLFVILALRARRIDSSFHKRMIILATVIPLPAAIDRITWLPATIPQSPLSADLYTLLWIAPMFAWDLFRLKRVHRAYLMWLAGWAPLAIAVNLLWGTPGWRAMAAGLLGY